MVSAAKVDFGGEPVEQTWSLRIGRSGSKSWTFRFMLNGKAREMGLGGLHKVGLADAREKTGDARHIRLFFQIQPAISETVAMSHGTVACGPNSNPTFSNRSGVGGGHTVRSRR